MRSTRPIPCAACSGVCRVGSGYSCQYRRDGRMDADVHSVDDANSRVGIRYVDRLRLTDRLTQPLVGDKVERLVPDQRTAETAAELIFLERRVGSAEERVEVVGRIKPVVPVVLEKRAVRLI